MTNPQPSTKPLVYAVGPLNLPEMERTAAWLNAASGRGAIRLACFAGAGLAVQATVSIRDEPDLMVVLLGEPDAISPDQAEDLARLAPLAPVIVVQGAWCASMGRSRQLWPPGCLVLPDNAPRRIELLLQQLAGSLPATPAPWLAMKDEAFLADYATTSQSADLKSVQIDLVGADGAVLNAAGDALTAAGAICRVVRPGEQEAANAEGLRLIDDGFGWRIELPGQKLLVDKLASATSLVEQVARLLSGEIPTEV
jgi:hypothetical protein